MCVKFVQARKSHEPFQYSTLSYTSFNLKGTQVTQIKNNEEHCTKNMNGQLLVNIFIFKFIVNDSLSYDWSRKNKFELWSAPQPLEPTFISSSSLDLFATVIALR